MANFYTRNGRCPKCERQLDLSAIVPNADEVRMVCVCGVALLASKTTKVERLVRLTPKAPVPRDPLTGHVCNARDLDQEPNTGIPKD